jgi:hypothetical protein
MKYQTITPKIRLAVAVMAFPVPLALVGNNSGVIAKRTPYITLLVKLYAQFQPKSALEFRAVVDPRMKTPVTTREPK